MAGGNAQTKQMIMLGVLLAGGGGYFGFQNLYTPRAAAIAELETRLEELQGQNNTARILAERGGEGEVERRVAEYREQLIRVEGLIPSSEELPDLLDAISMEAQRTGVELTLIQPTGAAAAEFYTRRTYELGVLGSFHQIAEFLARVGSLQRIVTPTELSLLVREETTRSGEPQLEARFSIETYILPAGATGSEEDGAS